MNISYHCCGRSYDPCQYYIIRIRARTRYYPPLCYNWHCVLARSSGVRFSPNGKFLLCATLDGKLRLWDAVASKCVKSFFGHKNHRLCAAPVFSVGGPRQEVAVGSEDGNVHVWDVQTRAPVHVIQRTHEGSAVLALDSCASRDLLATGGTGGTCAVKVWARGPSLPSSTTT